MGVVDAISAKDPRLVVHSSSNQEQGRKKYDYWRSKLQLETVTLLTKEGVEGNNFVDLLGSLSLKCGCMIKLLFMLAEGCKGRYNDLRLRILLGV